jgi:leucyl aminopeptidase
MQVLPTDQRPNSEHLLVAVLLADEPSEALSAHLSTIGLAPDLTTKARSEKGKKSLSSQANQLVLTMGLGSKPTLETMRRAVHQVLTLAEEYQCQEVLLLSPLQDEATWMALTEAALLSQYRFTPYQTKPATSSVQALHLMGSTPHVSAITQGKQRAEAVCIARDLVNEPVITLTAMELARRCQQLGQEHGFEVSVFDKEKITALGMGGLLAVNLGSQDPPAFIIMEYAPAGTEQEPPVVLVGKGVVYDTGGLSLKPTAHSMDFMKADMGGAAAVIGGICGVASLGIAKRVIALVPATDNRPGEKAYTPGDVIRMYDGSTVEVLNTDAEGRMILADALAYAKQYQPKIVIDLATLTGAQVVAIGSVGSAMMGTAAALFKEALVAAGEAVYERLVELPLWEEYGEMLRSDIADRKNIGGQEAGAITAGKFLEHFTDYPWIHLDIAGPSWLFANDSYRGKGASGVGVRLLIEFIERL